MYMSEKKSVFLGDTDGVFAWSQLEIIEEAKRLFGITLEYEKWLSHDLIFKKVIRETGLMPAIVAASLFSTEVMGRSLPIPGSQQAVKQMRDKAHIHLITGRPGEQRGMTQQWAAKHYPRSIREVHLRREKSTEDRNVFKLRMLRKLQATAYAEDDDRVIQMVLAAMNTGNLPHLKIAYLLDRPWNHEFQINGNGLVKRVGNWRKKQFGWSEIVESFAQL